MKSIEKFKQLIKDAVREVLNEEMGKLPQTPSNIQHQQIQENKVNPQKYISGDPIMDLLNETRQNMTQQDISNLAGYNNVGQPSSQPIVGNISQMLQGSTALDESQVSIDVVPDYSHFNID